MLGIINNLQMIIYNNMLYGNTMPFNMRDLSICRFWYPQGFLEPTPSTYQGMTLLPLSLMTIRTSEKGELSLSRFTDEEMEAQRS